MVSGASTAATDRTLVLLEVPAELVLLPVLCLYLNRILLGLHLRKVVLNQVLVGCVVLQVLSALLSAILSTLLRSQQLHTVGIRCAGHLS